jgi:hypothetical protein
VIEHASEVENLQVQEYRFGAQCPQARNVVTEKARCHTSSRERIEVQRHREGARVSLAGPTEQGPRRSKEGGVLFRRFAAFRKNTFYDILPGVVNSEQMDFQIIPPTSRDLAEAYRAQVRDVSPSNASENWPSLYTPALESNCLLDRISPGGPREDPG